MAVRADTRSLLERAYLRLILAGAFLVGIGILVSVFAPRWAVYVGGLFAAAAVGLVVNRLGPGVIERVAADSPIRALLGADSAVYSNGWSVVLPRLPLDEDHPPPNFRLPGAVRSWFIQRGAYDADTSHLRLALEGRSHETVTITNAQAQVIGREQPFPGALIQYPSAGESEVIAIEFDLDQPEPLAKREDGAPYFEGSFITLAQFEVQVMQVAAHVRRSAVQWRFVIRYLHRGQDGLIVIDNAGEPFRTTPAKTARAQYQWTWWDSRPSLQRADD